MSLMLVGPERDRGRQRDEHGAPVEERASVPFFRSAALSCAVSPAWSAALRSRTAPAWPTRPSRPR